MIPIFFWIVMLLAFVGGAYANRSSLASGGWSLLMWLAVLFLGLRVFPFHG